MRNYEKQLEIFGSEIADDQMKKENDKEWVITLDRYKVAQSISKIYSVDLRKVTDDLDEQIKKYKNKNRFKK